jgi:hypothetical protein
LGQSNRHGASTHTKWNIILKYDWCSATG